MPRLKMTVTTNQLHMSHFTVLVIGEDIDSALAPFQENNMGDCPKQYLVFHDRTAELTADYEKEEAEIKAAKYPTLAEYAEKYHGYKLDPEKNAYGYWENPNKKWDWYVEGGRWNGMLKVKPEFLSRYDGLTHNGTHVDSILIEHLDIAGMRDDAGAEAAKNFDFAMKVVEGTPVHRAWADIRDSFAAEGKSIDEARKAYHEQPRVVAWHAAEDAARKEWPFGIFGPGADLTLEDREKIIQFARAEAFTTHAVLKDGQWYEQGKMGWFACVSDDQLGKLFHPDVAPLVDGLPPETRITVVDCHI